jgi:hypothetical protein
MRKDLLLLIMLMAILGQSNVNAQEMGDFRGGVAGALGT